MQEKAPTIKEIAKRLKVSVSTVSRALSNHPRIGLGTRQAVQKLARELGYEPNAKAIFFKQKKTFIIGVILPSIREEFFSQAISGIESAAMEHHYTILFGQSYDNLEKEKAVVKAMGVQRVDGLIISLSKETQQYEHLEALKKHGIPVVYFDRVPASEDVHKVSCNLYNSTVEMIGWLLKNGYRRIAFINGPDKMLSSKERLQGYIQGLAAHKLKVNMQLVETTDLSKASTYAAVEKLLGLKQPPNAIISFNDYVHMDATQCAHKLGIHVNEDIAFASYANLPINSYTAFPPMLSIEQYPYRQGERALQVLIGILNQKSGQTEETTAFVNEELPSKLLTPSL